MKAIVKDYTTEIYPSEKEIKEMCKIGQGADCCIFLVVGSEFECCYYNRAPILSLIERARKGLTSARREGCDKVANFDPSGKEGEIEF